LGIGLLGLQAAATTAPPDVLVVGAGIGGLATSLEAARRGARVVVVDQSSVFGGHAVASEGGLCLIGTPEQKAQGIEDSPDLAYEDFVRWGEDANREWARLYADHALTEVHDWLAAMGVKFTFVRFTPGNRVSRFHENTQRGFGVVAPIYRECLRTGRVEFRWNTRVTRLLVKGGKVVGIEGVEERTGKAVRIESPAVVLATGGFQGNGALVKAHWPESLPVPGRILIGGGAHAVGSGLELAGQAGGATARMDHQWLYARGIPDPRYADGSRGVSVINRAGMIVNREGQRFANEVSGEKFVFPAMVRQTEGRGWLVFDAAGKKYVVVAGTDWGDPARVEREIFGNPKLVHKANTLEELARLAGLPEAGLRAGVERFNRLVREGVDADFGRFDAANPPDKPQPGRPPVLAVAQAPFYAIPIYPLTRKSMGGLATDLSSRVLDAKGHPIGGLYAVGEVAGFGGINGKAGLEGTFLGPSILQGRRLAQSLTAAGRATTSASVELTVRPTHGSKGPDCQSCHPLGKLLAKTRKGYWHFEKVHSQVVDKHWNCGTCHSELAPFSAKAHRIDRVAQISNCVTCHVGGK
jgi:flavocytochrome c